MILGIRIAVLVGMLAAPSVASAQASAPAAPDVLKELLTREEAPLAQQIAADQSRWSDVNNQLDELERSLTPRKQ